VRDLARTDTYDAKTDPGRAGGRPGAQEGAGEYKEGAGTAGEGRAGHAEGAGGIEPAKNEGPGGAVHDAGLAQAADEKAGREPVNNSKGARVRSSAPPFFASKTPIENAVNRRMASWFL